MPSTEIATDFTPLLSLAGGLLIGTSAVLLMLGIGRIMGATGILTGAILPDSSSDWRWRVAVLLGMFSGPWVLVLLGNGLPTISVPVSPLIITQGGFVVGVGVTLGSGCTSGHGVCGLARLAPRSIVAVPLFMLSTAATVFVSRHILAASI